MKLSFYSKYTNQSNPALAIPYSFSTNLKEAFAEGGESDIVVEGLGGGGKEG